MRNVLYNTLSKNDNEDSSVWDDTSSNSMNNNVKNSHAKRNTDLSLATDEIWYLQMVACKTKTGIQFMKRILILKKM